MTSEIEYANQFFPEMQNAFACPAADLVVLERVLWTLLCGEHVNNLFDAAGCVDTFLNY